jgi:flagellar protein FlaG
MNPISASVAMSGLPAQAAPASPVRPSGGGGLDLLQTAAKPAPGPNVDPAAAAVAAAAKAKAEVNVQQYAAATKEVMQVAAQQIQGYLRESGRNLNVSVDEVTGYYVARVVNPETGEVVRSLPSEETLRIARTITVMSGMLVNQKA